MDENKDKALNQEAVADNSPTASPAEETNTAPEVEEPEAEQGSAIPSEAEGEPTEGEGVKSRSAQGRIRKLVQERNRAEQERSNLQEQLRQMTDRYRYVPESTGGFPQEQVQEPSGIQAGQEYTIDEINERLNQAQQRGEQTALRHADNLVRIRLAQQENLNRIDREARESIDKYEVLNPKSEHYDPDLSDIVTRATRDALSANPQLSVKKYVERLIKPYLKGVTRAQAEATESAARQVSEQASRPTPAVGENREKDANKMSWQEIEKKVGIVG